MWDCAFATPQVFFQVCWGLHVCWGREDIGKAVEGATSGATADRGLVSRLDEGLFFNLSTLDHSFWEIYSTVVLELEACRGCVVIVADVSGRCGRRSLETPGRRQGEGAREVEGKERTRGTGTEVATGVWVEQNIECRHTATEAYSE